MDSISDTTFNVPTITHQPSSLSLNDVEELEIQCLAESLSHSDQNIEESEDNIDYNEPEAVLVEIEDVIEETAAALDESKMENNHHIAIYSTEIPQLW